jgi:hypothetical protein
MGRSPYRAAVRQRRLVWNGVAELVVTSSLDKPARYVAGATFRPASSKTCGDLLIGLLFVLSSRAGISPWR